MSPTETQDAAGGLYLSRILVSRLNWLSRLLLAIFTDVVSLRMCLLLGERELLKSSEGEQRNQRA